MEEIDEVGIAAEATAPVPGWGWTETSLLLMVVIWGVNFTVVKRALDAFEPLAFNALRFSVASVLVFAVLRFQGALVVPERRHVPRIILLGLLGNVVYQMGFILGLDRTSAGHASLMLALTPMFTALLSLWTGHESPGARTWGGAALSLLGVALVTGSAASAAGPEGRDALVGNAILMGAALVWAVYTVGSRPIVQQYGSIATTAWTLWVGTAGLVITGVPSLARQRWTGLEPAAWGGLAFSACFAIAFAYLIWYRGVERIGNTRTAIFSNLVPAVALLTGAFWLGERPSALALFGAVLTLGGVMWVRSDQGRGSKPGASAAPTPGPAPGLR